MSSEPRGTRPLGQGRHHPEGRATCPAEAINLNVNGRRVIGPLQGFGKLWQQRYGSTCGAGVTPAEVITTWKADFRGSGRERNGSTAAGGHQARRGGPAQPGHARPA